MLIPLFRQIETNWNTVVVIKIMFCNRSDKLYSVDIKHLREDIEQTFKTNKRLPTVEV